MIREGEEYKNMNLAIISQDKKYCQYISTYFNGMKINDVYSYQNISNMEKTLIYFEIILLDIDNDPIDKIEYSQQNRNKNFIFLSSTTQYIKSLFGPNIYAFIEKSDSIIYVSKIVQEVIKEILLSKCIIFKINNTMKQFIIKDIIYCQYIGNKNIVFVYHNQQYILKGYSLKTLKQQLGKRFSFVDQSTLINIDKFLYMGKNRLYIEGIRQYFIVSSRNKAKIKKLVYDKI